MIGEETKNKTGFSDELQQVLGTDATVRSLEQKESIEIRDLDDLITSEDLMEEIKINLCDLAGGPRIMLTRAVFRSLRMSIVELGVRGARELVREARITIRWVNCRIRDRIKVNRYFKCLGFGHFAFSCSGEERQDI